MLHYELTKTEKKAGKVCCDTSCIIQFRYGVDHRHKNQALFSIKSHLQTILVFAVKFSNKNTV